MALARWASRSFDSAADGLSIINVSEVDSKGGPSLQAFHSHLGWGRPRPYDRGCARRAIGRRIRLRHLERILQQRREPIDAMHELPVGQRDEECEDTAKMRDEHGWHRAGLPNR